MCVCLLVPTSRDLCRTMITGAEQLITNLHSVSRLRMSGAIPPLKHVPSWSEKDFTNIEKNPTDHKYESLLYTSDIRAFNMFRPKWTIFRLIHKMQLMAAGHYILNTGRRPISAETCCRQVSLSVVTSSAAVSSTFCSYRTFSWHGFHVLIYTFCFHSSGSYYYRYNQTFNVSHSLHLSLTSHSTIIIIIINNV